MKATLVHPNVGTGIANPVARVKLGVPFRNIGDADPPKLVLDVSFYRDGHHVDPWSFAKRAPGETKQWCLVVFVESNNAS